MENKTKIWNEIVSKSYEQVELEDGSYNYKINSKDLDIAIDTSLKNILPTVTTIISLKDKVAMSILAAKYAVWDSEISIPHRQDIISNLAKRYGDDTTINEGMAKAAYEAATSFINVRNKL